MCIEVGLNVSHVVLQYCVVGVVSWHCCIRRASRSSGLGCQNTIMTIYVSSKNGTTKGTVDDKHDRCKSSEVRAWHSHLWWEAMVHHHVVVPWHGIICSKW